MNPLRLFVISLATYAVVIAALTVGVVHFARLAWRSYEADRDSRCRVALSVQSTRRDSVTYAVDHHCENLIPTKR